MVTCLICIEMQQTMQEHAARDLTFILSPMMLLKTALLARRRLSSSLKIAHRKVLMMLFAIIFVLFEIRNFVYDHVTAVLTTET